MKTLICVEKELKNVAPRFNKAVWRSYNIGRIYNSATEARKIHNLSNCRYYYYNEETRERIKEYDNAKMDRYGRRYN